MNRIVNSHLKRFWVLSSPFLTGIMCKNWQRILFFCLKWQNHHEHEFRYVLSVSKIQRILAGTVFIWWCKNETPFVCTIHSVHIGMFEYPKKMAIFVEESTLFPLSSFKSMWPILCVYANSTHHSHAIDRYKQFLETKTTTTNFPHYCSLAS